MAGVLEMSAEGKPIWTGNDAVVVQLGDVLDRGDAEIGAGPMHAGRARATWLWARAAQQGRG